MIRLIALVILILSIMFGSIYWWLTASSKPQITPQTQSASSKNIDDTSFFQKIDTLEQEVQALKKELGRPLPSGSATSRTSSNTNIEVRLNTIETTLATLQSKVNTLSGSSTQTSQSTTSKSPTVYIPLGSGGTTTDKTGIVLDNYQVSIDPADYPNYKTMQLEATLKMNVANGTVTANLYNATDGSDVTNSSVSTTSDKSTLLSSYTFTLPSSKKTYKLKVKSSEGVEVQLQSARIKVNF